MSTDKRIYWTDDDKLEVAIEMHQRLLAGGKFTVTAVIEAANAVLPVEKHRVFNSKPVWLLPLLTELDAKPKSKTFPIPAETIPAETIPAETPKLAAEPVHEEIQVLGKLSDEEIMSQMLLKNAEPMLRKMAKVLAIVLSKGVEKLGEYTMEATMENLAPTEPQHKKHVPYVVEPERIKKPKVLLIGLKPGDERLIRGNFVNKAVHIEVTLDADKPKVFANHLMNVDKIYATPNSLNRDAFRLIKEIGIPFEYVDNAGDASTRIRHFIGQ